MGKSKGFCRRLCCQLQEVNLTGFNAKWLHSFSSRHIKLKPLNKFCLCSKGEKGNEGKAEKHRLSRWAIEGGVTRVSASSSLEMQSCRKPGKYNIDWE